MAVPDLRRIIAVLGAALASIVVLAACTSDRNGLPTYRDFDNRTGVAVTVVWERNDGERVTQASLEWGGVSSVHMNELATRGPSAATATSSPSMPPARR